METTTITREKLIYDFMMSSPRPAEELHFFVEAWDAKRTYPNLTEDINCLSGKLSEITNREVISKIDFNNNIGVNSELLPITEEPAPAPEPKKKVKSKKLYHANSKLTNAQFIDVWMDENDVVSFASQQAAADFLGVSAATVCEALKKKRRVKGYNLKRVDAPFTTNKKR